MLSPYSINKSHYFVCQFKNGRANGERDTALVPGKFTDHRLVWSGSGGGRQEEWSESLYYEGRGEVTSQEQRWFFKPPYLLALFWDA